MLRQLYLIAFLVAAAAAFDSTGDHHNTTSASAVPAEEPELRTENGDLFISTAAGEIYFNTASMPSPVNLRGRLSNLDFAIDQADDQARKERTILESTLQGELKALSVEKTKEVEDVARQVRRNAERFAELETNYKWFTKSATTAGPNIFTLLEQQKQLIDKQALADRNQALADRNRIAALERKVASLPSTVVSKTDLKAVTDKIDRMEKIVFRKVVNERVTMPACTRTYGRMNRGSTRVRLRSCSGINPNTWVVFHGTKDSGATQGSSYDFVKVVKVESNCYVTITPALRFSYDEGASQVQPAISYTDPNIDVFVDTSSSTAFRSYRSWNGNCGGIVAVAAAGNLELNSGVIDVSSQGYRGAEKWASHWDYQWGHMGEGWCDGHQARRTRSGRCLGGGAGNGQSGGAGGSHWGKGDYGQRSGCTRGQGYPSGQTSRRDRKRNLSFGGGGGAAGSHRFAARNGNWGGDGGGIVLIRSDATLKVRSSFKISANGGAGGDGYNAHGQPMGGGGGGAGGGIVITAKSLDMKGALKANGGRGGNKRCWGGCSCGGGGGKGSVGTIYYWQG